MMKEKKKIIHFGSTLFQKFSGGERESSMEGDEMHSAI